MHAPRKRFGQNFLTDSFVIQKIIHYFNLSCDKKTHVVEIGPGHGALTRFLVKQAPQLTILEIDRDLAEKLNKEYAHYPNLTIICDDALKFDFQSLYDPNQPEVKLKIIGNLPYNISTPLLFHLFRYHSAICDMQFMLQKEVVDRMVALPNSKEYGRLSVMTQYFCEAQTLFLVPPTAFFPAPKVESAIVHLVPHTKFNIHSSQWFALFDHLVKSAFSQRRKTISNALNKFITKEELLKLDINPLLRAENLSVQHYIEINDYLYKKQDIQPYE